MGQILALCRTLVVKKMMVEILNLSADCQKMVTLWLFGFLMSLDTLSGRKGSENCLKFQVSYIPRISAGGSWAYVFEVGWLFGCQMSSKPCSAGQREQTQRRRLWVEIRAERHHSPITSIGKTHSAWGN